MEILDKAQQEEDPHANVGSALAAVERQREAESKSETEALNAAREQRQFLLSFAEAYFNGHTGGHRFEGAWHFLDGVEATSERDNNQVKISWERGDEKYNITAKPKNRGAIVTTYKRPGYYYSVGSGDKGFAYLSDDGKQMEIMILTGNTHSFRTLRRS